jgi:hypothetical protein
MSPEVTGSREPELEMKGRYFPLLFSRISRAFFPLRFSRSGEVYSTQHYVRFIVFNATFNNISVYRGGQFYW